ARSGSAVARAAGRGRHLRAPMAVHGARRPGGPSRRPVRVSAATPGAGRAYSGGITNLERERVTMPHAVDRHRRRPAKLAARRSALSLAALAVALLAPGTAGAQSAP